MGICLPPLKRHAVALVAQRADGNREFARLLELCLTYEVSAVEVALGQARAASVAWSADTVRQLLNLTSAPQAPVPPLDPSQYPAYQGMAPPPDLSAYNRLLEVQP